MNEWWIRKGLEGSGRGLTSSHSPDIVLNGTEESHEEPQMDSWASANTWNRDSANKKQ
jgi:hypothetical protein